MTDEKITALTVQEFEKLVRKIVIQSFLEIAGDPDEGLALRDDFVAELENSLASVESGEETSSSEEVAARLGLTW